MFKGLLVDDEPRTLIGITKTFQWDREGFETPLAVSDPNEALRILSKGKMDFCFTDIKMPGISGIQLMQATRELGIDTAFVVISGFAEFSFARDAMKCGAFDYCLKPLDFDDAAELLKRLGAFLQKKARTDELVTRAAADEAQALPGEDQNAFGKLLQYVNVHFCQRLFLSDLAKRFYLNESYCCVLFKKTTGVTFSEYIIRLRMEKAFQFLTRTNSPLYDVARAVGYDDYFYFSKVYKKYHGVTASEHKRRMRKEESS